MTPQWYHWRYARVTVVWPIRIFGWWRAAGVIRVHDDQDKIPGDYHCAGTIIVKNKRYEVMGFVSKAENPEGHEYKAFYKYLDSLGLKRFQHVRAKAGNVKFVGKSAQK